MRSIQLLAPRVLEEREMPQPPDPGPGEVTVRMRAVGICGSDMHWYMDGGVGRIPGVFPAVLGHEPCAEVAEIGPGVQHFRTGDRVVIEPSITCGHCELCLSGRHNLCGSCVFLGGQQEPGMFREYANVPAGNLTLVPENLTDLQAALAEPLAVMMHMLELIDIRVGDLVAISGAGPIGMLAAATARACGARRIWICDPLAHRRSLALSMGADAALENGARIVEAINDQTRGRGVDVAIECAGTADGIATCINAARRGGTVMLIGIFTTVDPQFDIHIAMFKELKLQTLFRSNHKAEAAIRLLESGRIPASLITHRLPFSETPRGFKLLEDYSDGVGKVIVELR
jgi:L-iditol 2-dehydrogenase